MNFLSNNAHWLLRIALLIPVGAAQPVAIYGTVQTTYTLKAHAR